MKSIITIVAGIFLSTAAHAQSVEGLKTGSNEVRIAVGSSQSAVNIGAEYERRSGTFGVGGMLMQSTKNSDAGKPSSTTLGGEVFSHLIDKNNLDVYVAPGVAVSAFQDIGLAEQDDTVFGPTLKIGAVYSITSQVGVGIEYVSLYNWFSDKAASQYNFANAVVSMAF